MRHTGKFILSTATVDWKRIEYSYLKSNPSRLRDLMFGEEVKISRSGDGTCRWMKLCTMCQACFCQCQDNILHIGGKFSKKQPIGFRQRYIFFSVRINYRSIFLPSFRNESGYYRLLPAFLFIFSSYMAASAQCINSATSGLASENAIPKDIFASGGVLLRC